MSVAFEFHVTPTDLWPQCSMMVFMFAGSACRRRGPRPRFRRRRRPPRVAARDQRLADLLERLLGRHVLGQAIGPDLHARCRRCRRPVRRTACTSRCSARRSPRSGEWNSHVVPQPQITTPASAQLLLDVLRLRRGQRRLDAVLVRGAELDGGNLNRPAHFEQRRQVPLGRDVVGHEAELELSWRRGPARRRQQPALQPNPGTPGVQLASWPTSVTRPPTGTTHPGQVALVRGFG